METIFITGYSGTGKTMIGKLIASRKELKFVDTNRVIVEKENKSINEIYKDFGENYFDEIEREVIKNNIMQGAVISLSANSARNLENRKLIKTNGRVIYLRAKAETIYENLKDTYIERPYVKNNFSVFTIEEKLKEMRPYYEELANFIVDVDNKTVDSIFKETLAIYYYINKVKCHIYIK